MNLTSFQAAHLVDLATRQISAGGFCNPWSPSLKVLQSEVPEIRKGCQHIVPILCTLFDIAHRTYAYLYGEVCEVRGMEGMGVGKYF